MSITEIPESAGADNGGNADNGTAKKGGRPGITFETIALLAFILAFAAALVAVFALSLAVRSIDEHRAIPEGGSGGGGSGALAVSLTEFKITPGPATVASGGSLDVTNDGTTVHDLTVEGLATPELAAGESATLDVSSLAPGTYELYCQIAGHRDSGMETELTVE
ncbi:MAG: cupredoxin domain-containing protein [Microthrixaceae bacterium]